MTKKNTLIVIMTLLFSLNSCNKDDDPCTESIWYEDIDSDGFGNTDVTQSSCTQPENYVSNSDDIDDTDANLNPNTVWQGDRITFTKENNADWTLEANQDRITEDVWITRKSDQTLFNIVSETSSNSSSPSDTEWAFGKTADIRTLTFNTFNATHEKNPTSVIDLDMVLHLITNDIYIDIKFTSFSGGGSGGGGGFSYQRSTMN